MKLYELVSSFLFLCLTSANFFIVFYLCKGFYISALLFCIFICYVFFHTLLLFLIWGYSFISSILYMCMVLFL